MNELINQASMTSVQMADLCKKRHDSVKRTIEMLSDKGVISHPHNVIGIKAANGIAPTHYLFTGEQGKRDSIIVVAQLSPEFTAALVDRWQELEGGVAKPAFQIPQTLGEALQLAANQALQIEQDAPKVAHYNAVADRSTLLNATQVAHSVGLKSPQSLNDRLKKVGVYNGAIKRGKAFQSWFIEDGLGVMKQGNTGHMQPLFTTKGQIWVFELLGGDK